MTMTPFDDSAVKIAEYLLQIKAIKLQPEQPFTWASGWKSPIYCDNRKTLSYPQIRTFIRQQFVSLINEKFAMPDVIAGVATGPVRGRRAGAHHRRSLVGRGTAELSDGAGAVFRSRCRLVSLDQRNG